MKNIEIDDELYHYIASRTQFIGESASDILRRLLRLPSSPQPFALVQQNVIEESKDVAKPKKKETNDQDLQKVEKVMKSEIFTEKSQGLVLF